jgi:hypothetical protein
MPHTEDHRLHEITRILMKSKSQNGFKMCCTGEPGSRVPRALSAILLHHLRCTLTDFVLSIVILTHVTDTAPKPAKQSNKQSCFWKASYEFVDALPFICISRNIWGQRYQNKDKLLLTNVSVISKLHDTFCSSRPACLVLQCCGRISDFVVYKGKQLEIDLHNTHYN